MNKDNNSKQTSISKARSLEEIAEFWDTHSLDDYWDQTHEVELEILDAAEILQDLSIPPSNQLEKLKGDRANQHSIRINDQWRICFEWRDGDAHNVEIVDYH